MALRVYGQARIQGSDDLSASEGLRQRGYKGSEGLRLNDCLMAERI